MLELIKELNDFENLLKIDTDNITEGNKRKEKDEITKINEEKNKNEKIYERNKKIINEVKNKIVNINNTNLEMNQKIQKLNLNTQNYILIPKINFTPNEKEVNIDSRILYKKKDFDLVNEYLESIYEEKKIRYKLIYRASEDGAFGKIFKNKVSRTKRTLIIISTKNNKTFGGFTEALWNNSNTTRKDEKAFCFSLDKNKIYKSKKYVYPKYCKENADEKNSEENNDEKNSEGNVDEKNSEENADEKNSGENADAIYCKENAGPIFCQMFGINKNFIKDGGYCVQKDLSLMKFEGIQNDYELADEPYFKINELEVFEIKFE